MKFHKFLRRGVVSGIVVELIDDHIARDKVSRCETLGAGCPGRPRNITSKGAKKLGGVRSEPGQVSRLGACESP